MDDALASIADNELVERSKRRDNQAFTELIRRNERSALRTASSILPDAESVEDEVQNACLKAWQHVGQFQGHSKFSTWMLRIVTNQCLMRLRAVGRARMVSLDKKRGDSGSCVLELPDARMTAEEQLRQRELVSGLREHIRALPPLLRRALLLHDVDQVPIGDVATLLGISRAAAKSRLCRARTELKKRMVPQPASSLRRR